MSFLYLFGRILAERFTVSADGRSVLAGQLDRSLARTPGRPAGGKGEGFGWPRQTSGRTFPRPRLVSSGLSCSKSIDKSQSGGAFVRPQAGPGNGQRGGHFATRSPADWTRLGRALAVAQRNSHRVCVFQIVTKLRPQSAQRRPDPAPQPQLPLRLRLDRLGGEQTEGAPS